MMWKCAFLVAVVAAGACSDGHKRGAVVQGDAFLLMKSGDTKQGAGLTVYLVRDTATLASAIQSACDAYPKRTKALTDSMASVIADLKVKSDAASDRMLRNASAATMDAFKRASDAHIAGLVAQESLVTAAGEAARVAVLSAIKAHAEDSTGTGVNAHYRFSSVPIGKHFVFGEWSVGNHDYQWLAPLELRGTDSVQRDLDNSVEASKKLSCGTHG